MRYVFFTNTPAHVHLYRHAIERLDDMGHEVTVLARDYGCTIELLEYFELPHVIYGSCNPSKGSLFVHLPGHYFRIARAVRRLRPDVAFGIGAYAAHASALARCRCVLVIDSEPTTLDHRISRPFADVMLTPASFRRDLGPKHFVFDGFKESAYLHPDVFTPDPSVRDELGVAPDERFVLVRFNAFGSHHDIGHSGFPPERRVELVEKLAAEATVFVSDEGEHVDLDAVDARPFELHPARLHDALAAAELLVADTQTMVTEAALLATPAVRSNSFVGADDMGNFIALEQAGLIHNAETFEEAVSVAVELAGDPTTREIWRSRRDEFVDGMTNLTELLVEIATGAATVEAVADSLRSIDTAT
ncbi:MAG: glycosyltransferase [Halobacteriota archaeon]